MNTKKWRGYCIYCGLGEIKTNATKYCSLQCHRDYRFRRCADLLERGLYPPPVQSHGFIKKYLLRRLGEQCTRCGWAIRHAVTRKVPIEVEHIDGNWRNNRLDNLTLLCPNCHSLTPTYRGLNRGRGRETRLGGRANPAKSMREPGEARPKIARKVAPTIEKAPTPQLQLF